jgi:hypothetical protein
MTPCCIPDPLTAQNSPLWDPEGRLSVQAATKHYSSRVSATTGEACLLLLLKLLISGETTHRKLGTHNEGPKPLWRAAAGEKQRKSDCNPQQEGRVRGWVHCNKNPLSNPLTPYIPYLSQWTRPKSLHILLITTRSRNKDNKTKTNLRGLSPRVNYSDRATAACRS